MTDGLLGGGCGFGDFMVRVKCPCGEELKVHAQANALAPQAVLCPKCFTRVMENELKAKGGDHD